MQTNSPPKLDTSKNLFPPSFKNNFNSFSSYKNRKNKTWFGKNSFGENLGVGDK